jgi:hypothetical protein
MKSTELKKMIKDSVKEAIQEELKDILLEAVRTPKTVVPVMEQTQINQPNSPIPNEQKRIMYEQALGETSLSFNSSNVQGFKPQPGYDPANGTLPNGEVDMSQIMGLMKR